MQCNALNCKAKGAFWEQKIGGSNPLVPIKNYVNVMLAKCACYLETVT